MVLRPSLADRVKSNKRSRSDSSHSKNHEGKKDIKKERERERGSSNSSPGKKQVKLSPTKSSSSGSYTNSYISSTYLTSSAPQLRCISSSMPAGDKFDAMVNELFELGSGDSGRKKSSTSDDDNTDTEENDNGKKHRKGKTNGEVPGCFNITLSGETLSHFVAVTAKLKRSNQMQSAPTSKVTTLLTALTQQLTVQAAGLRRRRSHDEQQGPNVSDDEEEDYNITTSTQLMHKFESCCDCSLIALNVLSSKGLYFCVAWVEFLF